MGRLRRGLRAAAVSALLAGALASTASPGAAAAKIVRYATPIGEASATCPQTEPCDIETAINSAPTGSEIVVEPGTYGSAAAPLNTTLGDAASRTHLYIHGQTGKPLPVIDTVGGAFAGVALENDSRISRVAIDYSGAPQDDDGAALFVTSGAADHVSVLATTGTGNAACDVTTTLTDSLCVSTASQGAAIEPTSIATINLVLRGDTAVATAANSQGLLLGSNTAAPQQTVTVTNSIIHGTVDVAIQPPLENSRQTVAVTAANSDLATHYPATLPSGDSLTTNSTDLTAAPRFVNGAAGNYAERATSPTVNAGTSDPSSDTDLAGSPRTLGRAPDIGAYELRQAPTAAKPKLKRRTTRTVTLTVSVNPEGLPTTAYVVAVRGHDSISSARLSAGHSITGRTLKLTLHGLHKHTRYRVHAVAKNAARTVLSAAVGVTTTRH